MSVARRLDTTEFKGVSNLQYYGPNMYAVRIITPFSGFPYQSRYILAKTDSK